jgi:predicted dehydrogenase
LLHNESLDALYIAVPHNYHHQILQESINHGISALIEKPITRTLDEGINITKSAKERNVKVGVNYQYRYDKACYALAKAIHQNKLGKIISIRCNVPWKRDISYFNNAPWHKHIASSGGGTLITQASHFIDVVLWALNERPQTAAGYISKQKFPQFEIEDLAQAIIEMESGALFQINSTMAANPEGSVKIEIYAEKGTATYTNKPAPCLKFYGLRIKKSKPPVSGFHSLGRSLEGFRAWIMDDQLFLTPAEDSLPALAVVESIYLSASSGQREKIPSYDIN